MKITVYGLPAPQGSKRFVGHAKSGRGIMIESSKAVKPWRQDVKYAAMEAMATQDPKTGLVPPYPFPRAVQVTMVFTLPRPKSAKKDAVPSKKPDLSKLVRATEDALTDAGVWEDDARVVDLVACKRYVGDIAAGVLDRPGAVIVIWSAETLSTQSLSLM